MLTVLSFSLRHLQFLRNTFAIIWENGIMASNIAAATLYYWELIFGRFTDVELKSSSRFTKDFTLLSILI